MIFQNTVILAGTLVKDFKVTRKDNMAYAHNVIAVDRHYTSNGEKKKETAYVNFVVFNKTADHCEKYVGKGCQVLIEGRINSKDRELDGGQKITELQIITEKIQFITFKKDAQKDEGKQEKPKGDTFEPDPEHPF